MIDKMQYESMLQQSQIPDGYVVANGNDYFVRTGKDEMAELFTDSEEVVDDYTAERLY